ncbi:MAG: alpha/beta fold hydrolase [Chitinophagaceae bacterium]
MFLTRNRISAMLLFLWFSTAPACKKSNHTNNDFVETDPPVLLRVTMNVHEQIGGFYLAHPARYNETSKNYPLIMFIHGGGQYGSGAGDLPRLLTEGIPQLLKEKKFPSSFESGGKQYSFIVVVPQFKNFPDNDALSSMLNYVRSAYRIDSTRIYLTGFSLGGRIVCDYAAAHPEKISAFIALSGVSSYDINGKSRIIGEARLPAWGFHNRPDQVFRWEDTKDFISGINASDPNRNSRLTIFEDSTGIQQHDSWSKATDPKYKENGKNIYEWMLQFKR